MLDAAASFCLACALMAAIAIFERLRDWLLYVDIASRWGNDPHASFYLSRGGSVRAQVSAGHSIALGHLLAIAFGFWLYLRTQIRGAKQRIGATLLLWGGLLSTFSRDGWLGAGTVYFTFIALAPRAVSRLVKGITLAIVMAGLLVVSPMGDTILQMLPQAGQPADIYRHRLAERGWDLVFAHPFFGNQFPWPEMEDLRQGEGIIDLVNSYLGVALTYGFIGLFCFLGFILLGMTSIYARTRELVHSDPDLALFGTSLIACIVGTLVMIESESFNLGAEKMFYVLAGLATAYARLARLPQQRAAARPVNRIPQERS
jgi:O-antigen ligase